MKGWKLGFVGGFTAASVQVLRTCIRGGDRSFLLRTDWYVYDWTVVAMLRDEFRYAFHCPISPAHEYKAPSSGPLTELGDL